MDVTLPPYKAMFLSIFKFLNIDDRKKVRLTCKAWNTAGNFPEIVEREKFVFHIGNFGFDKERVELTGKFLSKCKNLRSDFEFHELPLHLLPSIVWKQIGDSVQSLYLNDCEVDDKTIGNVILHCSILTSFHVQLHSRTVKVPEKRRVFVSEKTLEDLIKSNHVQKNLVSLQLFFDFEISKEICPKIYKIYPNIQSFGSNIQVLGYLHTKKALEEFPPMITNLTYFVLTGTTWMVPFCENSKYMLRELKLRIDFDTCDIDVVKEFFSTQPALEKINFLLAGNEYDEGSNEEDVKEIMFLILNNCPKLRVLDFEAPADQLNLTEAEFSNFLNEICRLDNLSLKFSQIYFKRSTSDDDSGDSRSNSKQDNSLPVGTRSSSLSTKRKPLKFSSLKLMFPFCEGDQTEEFILIILKMCRALQSLSLEPFNNKILKHIHVEHVGIKKLYLTGFVRDYDQKTGPQKNKDSGDFLEQQKTTPSLNQLQSKTLFIALHMFARNLEYLSIKRSWNLSPFNVFDTVLATFIFSKLKYFHCSSFCTALDLKRLVNTLTREAYHLESLSLESELLEKENELMVLCIKNLKKLKFLRLSCTLKMHQAQELFSACPLLKGIQSGNYGCSNYLYNRSLGTLLQCGLSTVRAMCKFADDQEEVSYF